MINTQDNQHKGNILVVDDTFVNLDLLSTMLTDAGYKVRKALNGKIALMGVKAAPPDLILLDINMPEMNGYQLCEQLKADEKTRDIPVIFLSALDDVLDKVKAFSVGGVDYITKPFQFEEVMARVENHLTIRYLQKKLSEQNSLLQESEAKEREKAQELERTLKKLQQTQVQLIQSEKMSSLGQLVAGIAHEINNPINFIYGNLSHVAQYADESLLLLDLYQQTFPNPSVEIESCREALDLEFVKEDLPKIITSMKGGAERVRDIVLSLRNFSRLGESELKQVDIHEGLESTLSILQHRLNAQSHRPHIHVIKDYASLPKVKCYAGQINQVFLNIINNSIDAFDNLFENHSKSYLSDKTLSHQPLNSDNPRITIRTQLIDSLQVSITIADNGPGMSEVAKKKAFEPFFTTKQVGAGTGLGLSTSYQIVVDLHRGKLAYESDLESGAIFAIVLPINQET